MRDKLLRVSQLFSSQATDQIHFNDAESRWAYLGTYTAAHATLVHATVTSGRFEPLTEFVKKAHKKERSVIQCFSQKILFEAKLTLASCADILWAHHAIFFPHDLLLKPREHSLPSCPDHSWKLCPKDWLGIT